MINKLLMMTLNEIVSSLWSFRQFDKIPRLAGVQIEIHAVIERLTGEREIKSILLCMYISSNFIY